MCSWVRALHRSSFSFSWWKKSFSKCPSNWSLPFFRTNKKICRLKMDSSFTQWQMYRYFLAHLKRQSETNRLNFSPHLRSTLDTRERKKLFQTYIQHQIQEWKSHHEQHFSIDIRIKLKGKSVIRGAPNAGGSCQAHQSGSFQMVNSHQAKSLQKTVPKAIVEIQTIENLISDIHYIVMKGFGRGWI